MLIIYKLTYHYSLLISERLLAVDNVNGFTLGRFQDSS
jgi:hypothetical protein